MKVPCLGQRVAGLVHLRREPHRPLHQPVADEVVQVAVTVGGPLAGGLPQAGEHQPVWQHLGVGAVGVEGGQGGEGVMPPGS